jgi:type III pantothenate kinase
VAVTLGNSSAALALAAEGAAGTAVEHVRRVPVDRLEDLAAGLAQARARDDRPALPIIVASVNPGALERLRRLAAEAAAVSPLVAGTDFTIPIKTDVDDPERVGTDRLLEALAAYRRFSRACIVADFGTAITVNAIRPDGTFVGGAIFPGLAMMARALSEGTALLPTVAVPTTAPLLGRNTEQAIAAGILRGAAGAVTGLIAAARRVVGSDARVVLTGGAAPVIADLLPADCRVIIQNLVFEGLLVAYDRWKNR